MEQTVTVLFSISSLLLLGMLFFLLSSGKAGVYPPKQVLRRKAAVLGISGAVFLLIGYVFQLFLK